MKSESVTVRVVGEISGETFDGSFRVKVSLSHGDQLEQDRVRRELLGEAGGAVGIRASRTAEYLSQCFVRVIDAPSWWKGSADATGIPGRNLEDDDVLAEVYAAIMGADVRVKRALEREAEEARKALADNPPKG